MRHNEQHRYKSAVASKPESYLDDFGIEPLSDSSFLCVKKYLVRPISPKSNCETFDDLRYETCKTKQKALNELPPTSGTIRGHLLRSYYIVCLCWNLLDSISKTLQPGNCEWIIENEQLVPGNNFSTVLSDFTTKCHCKKRCTKNCGWCKRTSEKCTCTAGYCDSTNCGNA